jgi:uncharacterized protein (DUF169 family)
MSDYRSIERKLMQALGGGARPVAIAFLDAAPVGVEKFAGSTPSSCSFWPLAAHGRTFYTVPGDHQNCPIGGYTHNVLQPERMPELQQTLELMGSIGYVRMEEVSGVFQMKQSAAAILYAPLGETPVAPSAVIVSGKPARVMLIAEAAARAGEMSNLPMLGRPTCMAIPAAAANGAVASAGCMGNRVYTSIGEDDFYIMLRGPGLERVADELPGIEAANQTLREYHRERKIQLTN